MNDEEKSRKESHEACIWLIIPIMIFIFFSLRHAHGVVL